MKKLLLVDGNSVLFRAYYATFRTNPMSTSTGLPTNAVFGFISMLSKAITDIQPDAVLVAWDAGKKTFRHDKMESYKGTRKPLDDEIIAQMPIVREYLDDSHIMRYEQEGYEADDIIGSVSAAALDMETTILTSDKDLLQLADDHTKVIMMKKGLQDFDVMDVKAIEEKYGLEPLQIIDLKGLMGDPSDNIPGVKGIGEKTALALLHEYKTIDGVYEHIDEIKGRRKTLLEEGKESAMLSREIATIFRQMDLPFDMNNLAYQPDEQGAADFYQKYEMKSLLGRLDLKSAAKSVETKEVDSFDGQADSSLIVLPVATFAPFLEQKLLGFVYPAGDEIHYLSAEKAIEDEAFLKLLKEDKTLIAWDAKNDWHLLKNAGFPLPDYAGDLHLQVFLLHSAAYSLEDLIEAAGITLPMPIKDLSKKSQGGFTKERALPVFASWLSQLKELPAKLKEEIAAEDLDELYETVEFPLARILFEMECEGIAINKDILLKIGKEYQQRMDEIAFKVYQYAGHEFNIGSTKQLAAVLFDELKLKGGGKKRSTAADVLEKMKGSHPIVDEILEYRKYSKIVSTYIDGLEKYIHGGKIYTTFNQTATATGRLSSSDPNLQNISIKSEEGRAIRQAFEAPKGYWLISADYSQVELRMLAHMANEQFMIQAFNEGVDIHNRTASVIFGVAPDEVTPEQRRVAKTVNFAIIYGQTEFGLSQELGISRVQARTFIASYFASYPNIHRFMDGLIAFCEEYGYVETLMHRRREIPEIQDKNFMVREFGKRAAMNAPIQGSAADLIKIAMIHMAKALKEKNLKSRMLLQIHDELIFLVPDEELETMKALVPEVMDHAMNLQVPLEASVNYGRSWYEAK